MCRTYRLVFLEPPGSSIHAPPPAPRMQQHCHIRARGRACSGSLLGTQVTLSMSSTAGVSTILNVAFFTYLTL